MRVDVHLLNWGEPEEWKAQCLASLAGAAIALHELPGIPGEIGQARCQGFAIGALPYVSFVDPDDTYDASVFEVAALLLDKNPGAAMVYTDEAKMDESGRVLEIRDLHYDFWAHMNTADHVHGVMVFRRALIESCMWNLSGCRMLFEWALTLMMARQGKILHLPMVGRQWRQHGAQAHKRVDVESLRVIHHLDRSLV